MEKLWQDFLAGKEKGKHSRSINQSSVDPEEWRDQLVHPKVISQRSFCIKFREDSSYISTVSVHFALLGRTPCAGGIAKESPGSAFHHEKNGDFPKVPS